MFVYQKYYAIALTQYQLCTGSVDKLCGICIIVACVTKVSPGCVISRTITTIEVSDEASMLWQFTVLYLVVQLKIKYPLS